MARAEFLSERNDLPRVLTARGYTGTGVEVGVQRGVYSEVLLSGSTLGRLILVDPWREFHDYDDVASVTQADHDLALADARRRLERFGDRVEFWRTTSLEAAPRIPDRSLDFVYLDGRHDYDSVLADLAAWHPKLKSTGLLAGHDYVDGELSAGTFGVQSAVDEFAAEHGLSVYSTYAEPEWPTWIVLPQTRHARLVAAARTTLRYRWLARRKVAYFRRTGRWR